MVNIHGRYILFLRQSLDNYYSYNYCITHFYCNQYNNYSRPFGLVMSQIPTGPGLSGCLFWHLNPLIFLLGFAGGYKIMKEPSAPCLNWPMWSDVFIYTSMCLLWPALWTDPVCVNAIDLSMKLRFILNQTLFKPQNTH